MTGVTKRSPRTVLAVAALAVLAAGCSSTPAKASAGTREYRGEGLSFKYPASWGVAHYNEKTAFANSLVFISNEPMHNPCTVEKARGQCIFPTASLGKAGVILEWNEAHLPAFSIGIEPGSATTIDGRQARVEVVKPGLCFQIKASETLQAAVADPEVDHYHELIGCLRGPLTKAAVEGVNEVLHSTRFTSS